MLILEQLTKTYRTRAGEIKAIDNLSFTISEGDFITLVGPSGSGKTTLLLMIGAMLSPSEGKVFINGQSLYDLSVNERTALRRTGIGFVFQTFHLIPYLTALQNVQVPLFLNGMDSKIQKERACLLMERLGLENRMDHKPAELSVGQQQRVALARTLANNPSLILADEPTGSLDPEMSQNIISFLKELNQEGKTIVMVTHNHEHASQAKRTFHLSEGKIH